MRSLCAEVCARHRDATEKEIQNAVLTAVGSRSDARLWRSNNGVAFSDDRAIRFGVRGQADLSGILAGGRRLEIEVKRRGARQRPDQILFQAMIERFGGVYVLARPD